MWTFSTMSLAFCCPMPWMYWSAMTTRLFVGMFTPAIRATASLLFRPAPGGSGRLLCRPRRAVQAITRRPPLASGAGIVRTVSDWIPGLLRDSASFRQPPATPGFLAFLPVYGGLAGGRLAGRLRRRLGGRPGAGHGLGRLAFRR